MSTVDGPAGLINPVEATQKLKEILNVGQAKGLGGITGAVEKATINGNGSDSYADGSARMLESITKSGAMTKQYLPLKGTHDSHSFDIYSQDVTVVASPLNYQPAGSSRVQIRNIVDYGWEHKYYFGRLVVVHLSGNYLAYAIIARDKRTGIVRVNNRKTGERNLLKGMTGSIKDLAFAHIMDQVLLACVDEIGNLFVYKVVEENGKTNCNPILTVTQPSGVRPSDNHRVIWCQYIPEEPVDDPESTSVDASKLLVVTHDDKAEMLNVDLVTQKHGTGPIAASSLYSGYQIITDHKQPIVDAAFSPDGAALATASLDGEVKFFQVYLHEDTASPRCLHQWMPHDGKPLSCLFFLDNHNRSPNPDVQFWKFAITGADHNQEIKVWSCESWSCLQTIRFEIPQGDSTEPCIKAGLDLSATYLMLSDIYRKVFYVLLLNQDFEKNLVTVCSISEFPLSFPILSYAILDASRRKYKQSVDNEHMVSDFGSEDEVQEEELDGVVDVEGVVVKLFYIQPKSLQQCTIAYQPNSSIVFPAGSVNSLSQDSLVFRDRLSDMSFDTPIAADLDFSQTDDIVGVVMTPIASAHSTSANQILLTPDAFTSSPNHCNATPTSATKVSAFPSPLPTGTPSSIPLPPATPSEEAALATPTEEIPLSTSDLLETEHRHSGRSSGSSPSLEVQQILAPRKRSVEGNKSSDDEIIEEKNDAVEQLIDIGQNAVIDSAQVLPTITPESNSVCENFVDLSFTKQTTSAANSRENFMSSFSKQPPPVVTNVREYDPTIWPQAPNLAVGEQRERKLDFSNSGSGEPRPVSPQTMEMIQFGKKLEHSMEAMQDNLQIIRKMLMSQQAEMLEMRKEMRLHHGSSANTVQQGMSRHFEKLEATVSTMLERLVLQIKQADYKCLEDLVVSFEKREQQNHDRLVSALTQTVANSITNKLEIVVKSEVRSVLIPMISNLLEPIKDQIQIDIAQKLSATDSLMKENISKLVKSKAVVEAIGSSAAVMLQGLLPAAYRDSFQSLILPLFEKACQTMFQQINENFRTGTKEYVQTLERHLERRRKQTESTSEPILSQIQSATMAFHSTSEQLSSNLMTRLQEELAKQLQAGVSSMQEAMIQRVQHLVRDEISNAMKEQQNAIGDSVLQAIRSRAVTPVPSTDPQIQQAHILQLAKQGQYNSAFQQALSAADLSLVTFVCETIPPEQVFGQSPCPLQQPVLLSLIQQLSSDLSFHTEIKIKYLQDAVINLDRNNPITREHMTTIISSLQQKLQLFVQSNPSGEYNRSVRMLLLASETMKSNSH